jgi:hypothetical protein
VKEDDGRKNRAHAYAAETLHNEVERFWKRSLFFWGFIAAAFVGYGVLIEKKDPDLPLAISCFGLICSFAWTLANRGSKYWQFHWEEKLKSVELGSLGRRLFAEDIENSDNSLWGGKRYSVTRLSIALSDFTVLIWLALAVKAYLALPVPLAWVPIILITATIAYVVALFVGGRSRAPRI